MAKKQNDLVIPNIKGVNAEINLDKKDLVTVFISRAETKITDEISKGLADEKLQRGLIKKTEEELKTATDKLAKDHFADVIDQLKSVHTTLKKLGSTSALETTVAWHNNGESISATLSIKSDSYQTISYSSNLALPAAFKKLQASLTELKEDLVKKQEAIIEWKKKLAQLPRLERQCVARLVEGQLAKSDEGQQLLDSLNLDGLDLDVKALTII